MYQRRLGSLISPQLIEKLKTILKRKNLPFRIIILIIIIIPIIYYQEFYDQFSSHFFGSIYPKVITRQWHIVILNIVLFLSFLIPLYFRRKINWKGLGIVTAFFVSLFVEMYGIPLTVYFASEYFAGSGAEIPNMLFKFKVFGVTLHASLAMLYGTALMTIGMLLILIAWITLYKNLKVGEIVTQGIYSYSRHPQYLGFILIILGWLAGWPTLLTVIFTPILIFMYVRVCLIEERELGDNETYRQYKKQVPFFV